MGDIPEIWCQTQQPLVLPRPLSQECLPHPLGLTLHTKMEPYSFQTIMEAGAPLVSPGSVKGYCYQDEG